MLLDDAALLLLLVPGVGGLEVDGLAAHRRRHNFYCWILRSLLCALNGQKLGV